MPQVTGLGELSDQEFDALAHRATSAYDDLMDLGMSVEARYSGRIFEVAASMLKNAIDAKNSKIDKKLKMVELQLKKEKNDNPIRVDKDADKKNAINGTGVIVSDRNSLIEQLKRLNK